MPPTPLPNPNRHITTTLPTGTSTFLEHPSLPPSMDPDFAKGDGLQRLAYETPRAPTPLAADADLTHYRTARRADFRLVPGEGGTKVWYNDIPPGGGSSMHRSVSLDVIVMVAGEVELELSGGETRTVRVGDVVVQRATMHRWRNVSATEWARMVAVVSDCGPVVVEGGEVLGEEGMGGVREGWMGEEG